MSRHKVKVTGVYRRNSNFVYVKFPGCSLPIPYCLNDESFNQRQFTDKERSEVKEQVDIYRKIKKG